MEQSSADKAAATDTTSGRRGRKRTTTANSDASVKSSNQQKGAKKRRKLVQESTVPSTEANQKETLLPSCMASMTADSEVTFKLKPRKQSSVKLTSHSEPSSSGIQQVTDSPNSTAQSSMGDKSEDKDVSLEEDDSLNCKKSCQKAKREKSVLCPKCGKSFTSMKRLLQSHYDEEMQTCKYEKQTKQQCPCCGRHFIKLQDHYDKETGTCRANFSAAVTTALSSKNVSEEQLYASLNEDSTISECNVVWRRILKLFKVLKCQNANCNHQANSINAMRYHVARCGKVIERLVCPICKKMYTTKPGLEYHMTSKHHGDNQEEHSPNLQSSEPELCKRPAAIKAAAHIAKASMDSQPDDLQPPVADEQSGSPGPSEEHLSEAQWNTIRKAFKNKEEVKCLSANCSLTFKSYTGFKYHVTRCIENKTLTCRLCNKRLTTLQRFQNHMKKLHNIEKESCLDYEYTRPSDDDDDEEEEEDEEKKQKSLSHDFHRNYRNLKNNYQEQLENLLQELTSREELFTDWQPSLKSWTRCRDCVLHAPVARHSMKFCFASSKNGTSPVSQLALFNAALEDEQYGVTGAIFNVGGPVWSMAWAPSEEDTQYVAMAAYRTLDETHRMDIPIKLMGLIQLWTVIIGKLELPRLSLGIAHDFGCIRSMKWCPSGCTTKQLSTTDGSETMSRLGLLALACSDGVARILSIPEPSELLERLGSMENDYNNCYNVFVTPKSICCLLSPSNIASQSDLSTLYGQCWDVEWLPRQPHNKIAASFSNGTVTIWDLLTKSWLLRGSHDHYDTVLYPQLHITSAHLGNICRTMSWCADDPNYLFTGGYDKRLCLWDLNHPEEPVDKWDRGLCWDSKWPLLCPGVFCLEDCVITHPYPKNLSFQEFQTGKSTSVIRSSIPQISFSYCHWRNTVAFGTITGDVLVNTLPPFIYLFRKPRHKQKDQICCVCTKLCDEKEDDKVAMKDSNENDSLTDNKFVTFYNYPEESEHQLEFRPDMKPVTAVTKIAWNPHHRYCRWLLMATNTGLVRLLKL